MITFRVVEFLCRIGFGGLAQSTAFWPSFPSFLFGRFSTREISLSYQIHDGKLCFVLLALSKVIRTVSFLLVPSYGRIKDADVELEVV